MSDYRTGAEARAALFAEAEESLGITGTALVDLDVTIRVLDTELPIGAAVNLGTFADELSAYLTRRVAREFSDAATVAVKVEVRPV
jgi:hypothetical protein